MNNLLLGLGRLFGNSEILITDSELEVNDKMHLRMIVAPIVRRLVKESAGKENTENLSQYTSYYESNETCWDIRNRYYDGE